jgi:hypothetical protein
MQAGNWQVPHVWDNPPCQLRRTPICPDSAITSFKQVNFFLLTDHTDPLVMVALIDHKTSCIKNVSEVALL